MRFDGKVVLVTGGTRGIGRAIVRKFSSLGANVAFNYINNEGKASQLSKDLDSSIYFKTDVSDFKEVTGLVKNVINEWGKIDIVVNNAGITKDKLLIMMKESDWDNVIDTNLKGVFNITKAVYKIMAKQRSGRIINISSIVGIMGNAGQANYAASKAGIIGFTKSIAKELASRGITVNAVAPGLINSDMTNKIPDDLKKIYKDIIPMHTLGEPEDVANAVVFLASDMARYITGQVLVVDGGMIM
jgi:3-oxoacyl-[acyl-carrier protein] reductase